MTAEPGGAARRRAAVLLDARRHDLARVEIGRALADDPDDGAAFHLLAILEQRVGHPDDALAALDRAAAHGLAPADGLTTRLITLYTARRFREAVATAEELLRHDPHQLQAHVLLAQMLGGEGRADYHRARAHAEYAVSLAPENDHAQYALGQVLASHHGRRGARAGLRHLREAVRLAPDDAANLNALGAVDLALGRSTRALRSFAAALALDPTQERPAFNVPLALLALVRRAALGSFLLLLAAVVAGVVMAPRLPTSAAGASPGASVLARVVAAGVVVGVVAVVVTVLRRAVPGSIRPAVSRAWRRDLALAPVAWSAVVSAAFALLAVVLPVVNGVHVTPLLTLGFGAWVLGRALSRSRTARYGLERRVERAELWRPRERNVGR